MVGLTGKVCTNDPYSVLNYDPDYRWLGRRSFDRGCRWDRVVLATGGGVILREENRSALASRGFVIYLHATVAEQTRRTRNDRNRPLLQTDDPGKVLADLMAIRDPLYREIADHVIDTDGCAPRAVAKRLMSELR